MHAERNGLMIAWLIFVLVSIQEFNVCDTVLENVMNKDYISPHLGPFYKLLTQLSTFDNKTHTDDEK